MKNIELGILPFGAMDGGAMLCNESLNEILIRVFMMGASNPNEIPEFIIEPLTNCPSVKITMKGEILMKKKESIRTWMKRNVNLYIDECNEVDTTGMVEGWDYEQGSGEETFDPNHPAWTIAAEIAINYKP